MTDTIIIEYGECRLEVTYSEVCGLDILGIKVLDNADVSILLDCAAHSGDGLWPKLEKLVAMALDEEERETRRMEAEDEVEGARL